MDWVEQKLLERQHEEQAKRIVELEYEVKELKKLLAEYFVKPIVHHCSSEFRPCSPPRE